MKYLQAALAISATMFCYTGFADEEPVITEAESVRGICQQIVQEVDQEMGQKVASCIPASSVKHGHPDLLVIVSGKHFVDEELRAKWMGLSILTAVQAVEKMSANSGLHLTRLVIDQADHERKELNDLSLCSLTFNEAEMLVHRLQAGGVASQLYKDSSCNRKSAVENTAAKD